MDAIIDWKQGGGDSAITFETVTMLRVFIHETNVCPNGLVIIKAI